MKTITRFTLLLTETADNVYDLHVRGIESPLKLTLEDDGWLLSDGTRHANVTLLPGGEIDWQMVMEKVRKWST